MEKEYLNGVPIHEGLLKAILIEMLPANVMEGVMVRLDKSQKYADVKVMILNYIDHRIDFGGPAPMDVGNIALDGQWDGAQEGERPHARLPPTRIHAPSGYIRSCNRGIADPSGTQRQLFDKC